MQGLHNSVTNNDFFSVELSDDQLDLVAGGAAKSGVAVVIAAGITAAANVIAAVINLIVPVLRYEYDVANKLYPSS